MEGVEALVTMGLKVRILRITWVPHWGGDEFRGGCDEWKAENGKAEG